MHLFLSVQAHYRNWISQHFELSLAGRRLKKYRNQYKGKRCFIVANGPSLCASDLDKLENNKEITFGMNRIYKVFKSTKWRPTFYVCEDELIAKEQQIEINAIESQAKFLPIELKWYHGIFIDNAKYFHINYKSELAYPYSFSTEIDHQIDCHGTVTFSCMQIAAYIGFEKIYLLGVDHNYQRIIDFEGNIVEDMSVQDYFCDSYDADIKDNVVHDMGNNTRAYLGAKNYCDENQDVTIYNATRGGKLEVFERVDFDSLF